jgi:uncharacterized integral membrane protein (TIGR00698 family)
LLLWKNKYVPGLLFIVGLALLSTFLGSLFPIIGAPIFGIIIGILINNIWGKPQSTIYGVQFSSKKILQWAIIALGCGLSLSSVWRTGVESAGLLIISLLAAFMAAFIFGRMLRIPNRLLLLIGVGTGICGGSAIAAISPIIEADEIDIAYSISTIFLFNMIAVLVFPTLGQLIGLSDQAFGLWAGTAINDTSSVVAAGYLYSEAAGDYATIVKLARSTMIIPIAFLVAVIVGMRKKRQDRGDQEPTNTYSFSRIFPWFILWFLVASLFNTLGLFGDNLLRYIGITAKFMIVMALTGIGLSSNFRKMLKTGVRPIILGLIVWFTITIVSLTILWMTGLV